jgi:hypothetical protein
MSWITIAKSHSDSEEKFFRNWGTWTQSLSALGYQIETTFVWIVGVKMAQEGQWIFRRYKENCEANGCLAGLHTPVDASHSHPLARS